MVHVPREIGVLTCYVLPVLCIDIEFYKPSETNDIKKL